MQLRAAVELVKALALDDRRREPELGAGEPPLRGLDLAGLSAVDRRHHPHHGAVEVFVAVRQEDVRPADDHARIDRALGRDVAPDAFAGLRLHGVHRAVAAADDQLAHAVDGRDDPRRKGGVVGTAAGLRGVDDLAGALVERDEAVAARAHRAPVGERRVDDHQVAVDDRRRGTAAVRRERRELFADRPVPQQLAVAAERDHGRAGAEGVHVAGFRIGGRRRPADAMGRHVALEDVEPVFPDELPGVGVERHDALLELGAAPHRILDEDAIAQDDRRRPSSVGRAPQEVLAVQRPFIGQSGFGRDAVAVRSAHLGPVAERDAPRSLGVEGHADDEGEDSCREDAESFQHRQFTSSKDEQRMIADQPSSSTSQSPAISTLRCRLLEYFA